MKKFKRIMNVIFILILIGVGYSFGVAVYEDAAVNTMIQEFKNRANPTPVLEQTIGGVKTIYFGVPRETSKGEDHRPVFSDDNKTRPGIRGDILVTQESPFPHLWGIHQFVSLHFGGHAALVTGDNETIEATGMNVGFTEIIQTILHRGFDTERKFNSTLTFSSNNWMQRTRVPSDPAYSYFGGFYRNTFLALRLRDEGYHEENVEIAIEYATKRVHQRALYNFLFFLDTRNKYYCTDLISRSFAQIRKQTGRDVCLNNDGFVTTVNDLILSRDTYITIFYHTVGNVRHVYFLAD